MYVTMECCRWLFQRRPSFPQSGSGDWSLSRNKHHNGKPPPTASSMAELQYEDDDVESPASSPTALAHAPYCRCFRNDTLRVPGAETASANASDDSSTSTTSSSTNTTPTPTTATHTLTPTAAGTRPSGQESSPSPGTERPDCQPVCTCQLSCVRLGGVTSPDGSKTSLSLAAAVTNNNKKPRRPRGAKPTVIFNVGGQTFETYRATLKRFKNTFFADDDKMRAYFRPAQGDYFFDRDPTAFGCVLNYLRTGDLHVPTTMCGPALQTELEFWGIDELDIERCCWTQYNTWKTQSRSLEKLEYDRKFSTTQNLDMLRQKSKGCWGRNRAIVWQFLQDPASSRPAKAYAWVSIIFVFISIFSFCADTHPVFRVKADDVGQFASVYRFFNLEFIDLHQGTIDPDNSTFITTTGSYNDTLGEAEEGEEGEGEEGGGHANNETLGAAFNGSAGSDGEEEEAKEEDLPHPCLLIMDLCCLIFFTLEYMTRFVCSPSKVNFLRSFQNVIDFVAISPDYVELLFLIFDPMRREGMAVMDLMFILRMLRLCRIFRLIRHVPGLWILLYTLKASFNELMLMFVFLLIGMVVFATLMHFAEGKNGFPNIPVGFWWSVVTMTTVGYGDMFPQTAAGYVIGSCCAVAGLLMIAFTVPIIVSNFVLYYTHVQYGLARRDRALERMEEEVQGQGDEENPQAAGNDVGGDGSCAGGQSDASESSRTLPREPIATRPRKTPVDSVAIALGENISLTSPAATLEDSVVLVDEKEAGVTAAKKTVLV